MSLLSSDIAKTLDEAQEQCSRVENDSSLTREAKNQILWDIHRKRDKALQELCKREMKPYLDIIKEFEIRLVGVNPALEPEEAMKKAPFYLNEKLYFSLFDCSSIPEVKHFDAIIRALMIKFMLAKAVIYNFEKPSKWADLKLRAPGDSPALHKFLEELVFIFDLNEFDKDSKIQKFDSIMTFFVTLLNKAYRTNTRVSLGPDDYQRLQEITKLHAECISFKYMIFIMKFLLMMAHAKHTGIQKLLSDIDEHRFNGLKIKATMKEIGVYSLHHYNIVLSPLEKEFMRKHFNDDIIKENIRLSTLYHRKPNDEKIKEDLIKLQKRVDTLPSQVKAIIHGRINRYKIALEDRNFSFDTKKPTYNQFFDYCHKNKLLDLLDECVFFACINVIVSSPKVLETLSYKVSGDTITRSQFYDCETVTNCPYVLDMLLVKSDKLTEQQAQLRSMIISRTRGNLKDAIRLIKEAS